MSYRGCTLKFEQVSDDKGYNFDMRLVFLLALTAFSLVAAEKKPLPGKDGNEKLDIEAAMVLDKAEIERAT